jgi:hypothetical protein
VPAAVLRVSQYARTAFRVSHCKFLIVFRSDTSAGVASSSLHDIELFAAYCRQLMH